jgi:phage shock protein A
MNQLTRFWYALRGKTAALLDELEDPEAQLSVFVGELNEQVQSLHRSVASAIADEKRLKMQIEDLLSKGAEWESRAVLALQQGNEPLAREALLRKDDCEAQSLALQKGWEAQKSATETLKASLHSTRTRVSEAKTKYNLLLAQYRSAAAKKKISESMSVTTDDSPMLLMDRLADRIRQIEAETEVNVEMSGVAATDLETKFVELERAQKGEAALQLLKSKLTEQRRLVDYAGGGNRIEELKAKLDKA